MMNKMKNDTNNKMKNKIKIMRCNIKYNNIKMKNEVYV